LIKELIASYFMWGALISDGLETAFLAANIYHESRSEPLEGQLCVAYVTIARSKDNNPVFGGPTLRSVVFKENVREDGRFTAEFSWWEKPVKPRDHRAVAAAWKNAKYALRVRRGVLCHFRRARYYKNTDVAGAGGSCWFKRNTVYVGSIGNHDFYRPHHTVFEWKHGVSKTCYVLAKKTASRLMPRIPRPRPLFTSSAQQVGVTNESVPGS
jgi:hypothetical protein